MVFTKRRISRSDGDSITESSGMAIGIANSLLCVYNSDASERDFWG